MRLFHLLLTLLGIGETELSLRRLSGAVLCPRDLPDNWSPLPCTVLHHSGSVL